MYLRTQANIYEFAFPLKRPHAGVPLGNGTFGALVWGDGSTLNITVSRNDFWDHRNEQYLRNNGINYKKVVDAYNAGEFDKVKELYTSCSIIKDYHRSSSLLPCGRFEFKLKNGEKLDRAALDIRLGRLEIIFASGRKLTLSLNMLVDILDISDPDTVVENITARPAWDFEAARVEMQERLIDPPVRIDEEGRCGWLQSCPENGCMAAICSLEAGRFLINTALAENEEKAKEASADALIGYDSGLKRLETENQSFWRDFWQDLPEVSVPEKFLNDFTPFAFYKFACATNPNAGKPAPLQGPWIEDFKFPPWGANYTINVNIEQIYTLAFHVGKFDFLEPLFKMLESEDFKTVMTENARTMFGIDDGYMLTHSINDRGRHCQNGFSTHSALDHGVTAWLGQLYWFYYKYTGDKKFLKDRAYPYLYRVLRVYEEMLEEYEGQLSLPFGPSPEYGVTASTFGRGQRAIQEGRDPSFQLAAIHLLTDALLEASEVLDKPARPIWHDIKERLPEFCVYDDCGEPHIALWAGQDLTICHRHHSHLACIYPFDTLKNMTTEKEATVNNSIDHWIEMGMGSWSEWCMPWAAIIQTRMGFSEAPELLLKIWEKLFVNETLSTVYLPKFRGITAHRKEDIPVPREENEIMQLEGTMAAATAVIEMLVHQQGDTVYLFKGVPEAWSDVSFNRVRLPGGFIISAARKGGKLSFVEIESRFGGELKLSIDGDVKIIEFKPEETIQLPERTNADKPATRLNISKAYTA